MPSSSWGHQFKPDCAPVHSPLSVNLTSGHLTLHQRNTKSRLIAEDPALKTRSGFVQGCLGNSDGSNPSSDEENDSAKIFRDFFPPGS